MNMLKILFAFFVAFILAFPTFASTYQNDTTNYAKKKNIVEILPVEFAFNRLGFSYERVLNEYISLRFPLQISVGDNFNSTIRYGLGTQLLFFPLKHKVVSYFAGISAKGGIIQDYYPYHLMDLIYPYPYQMNKKFFLPELLNGMRINLGEHFCLSSSFGMGFIKIEGFDQLQFKATGNFGMGFKF